MIKFLCRLFACFAREEAAGLEFSDGDRAALYGWPDKTIEDVTQHEQQSR